MISSRRLVRPGALLLIGLLPYVQVWALPHMELEVSVEPQARTFAATASITSDEAQIEFQLSRDYVVESLEVDGATIPASSTRADDVQRFRVDLPDATGTQTLNIRYHGELAAMDTTMTHRDTLQVSAGISSIAGSYLPAVGGWHPILDRAFTYRLIARVPEPYVAVAPGAPADEQTIANVRQASFVMDIPVDGIDLMVGPWTIKEKSILVDDTQILVRTYFDESTSSLADSYLQAAQEFIQRYTRQIGLYPYPVFSIVSSPIPTGFGIPSLTYLGRDVLHYPFIRDVSLGHEVLHNWWGGAIRVDASRGNWAEGLTTFMADYAFREEAGNDAAIRMRHGWLRDYAALPPGSERPLSSFRSRYHTASATIGYGKAAMMFYSLRNRLGSGSFNDGVRVFWDTYRFASADFNQLREAFERASGSDLSGFFNQWLDRTGVSEIGVAGLRSTGKKNRELSLKLEQSGDTFDLTVPLRLHGEEANVTRHVHLSENRQEFTLEAPFAVQAVEIDPDFELWRRLAPREAPPILRDIIAASQVNLKVLEPNLEKPALAFVQALVDSGASISTVNESRQADVPLIVVGSRKSVSTYVGQRSLGTQPHALAESSTAAWLPNIPTQRMLLVSLTLSADNERELAVLGKRLRHFGNYSWIGVGPDRETVRGNWPPLSPRIPLGQ